MHPGGREIHDVEMEVHSIEPGNVATEVECGGIEIQELENVQVAQVKGQGQQFENVAVEVKCGGGESDDVIMAVQEGEQIQVECEEHYVLEQYEAGGRDVQPIQPAAKCMAIFSEQTFSDIVTPPPTPALVIVQ